MTMVDPNAPTRERLQVVLDNVKSQATLRRMAACIGGGFVLALMVGKQEGNTQAVDGMSFRAGLLQDYRYLIFGAVGILLFLLITFWPVVSPFVRSPGSVGVAIGFLSVLVGMVLLKWFDPVGKFGELSDQVEKTPALGFPSSLFFGWLGYALWFACLAIGLTAAASRFAPLGYALALLGVFGAFCAYYGHYQIVDLASAQLGPDHSLGVYAATIGYLVFAGTGVVIARSKAETAAPREFVERVMAWRPGFPLVVVAAVLALIAFLDATWFAPQTLNLDYSDVGDRFEGTGVSNLALAWFQWLGVVLALVAIIVCLAGSLLRQPTVGLVGALAGLVGLVLNLVSMHAISETGAKQAKQYGSLWQNLGSAGWVACIVFSLLLTAGVLVATRSKPKQAPDGVELPVTKAARKVGSSSTGRVLLPLAIMVALFYPPTLTGEWQNTLVTQIGPYLLLAVGLNVVIGWAGLLDLGYIAFYAVGAYTTAFLTGSLPVKPPQVLEFFSSPLWAIPFAVAAALLAGVLLGAPTLRLRGDYLAIVTLGFGEIIQVVANNNPGGFTGGARGPNVPNPVLEVGPISITWGQDNLPYWYLLLALLVIVVVLFFRLERSRIGRAWAAIREDEVAAQASGVNTTRAKLLAFAIGASTSGLAGVFFATQVGYFDPSLFTLQNSILIVAYVVFGGMGSLPGALAGAAVLTWLPVFLKSQVPQQDQQMWIGALVLLMMIFRPAGLIPARRRQAELTGLDTPATAEPRAVPVGEGM